MEKKSILELVGAFMAYNWKCQRLLADVLRTLSIGQRGRIIDIIASGLWACNEICQREIDESEAEEITFILRSVRKVADFIPPSMESLDESGLITSLCQILKVSHFHVTHRLVLKFLHQQSVEQEAFQEDELIKKLLLQLEQDDSPEAWRALDRLELNSGGSLEE